MYVILVVLVFAYLYSRFFFNFVLSHLDFFGWVFSDYHKVKREIETVSAETNDIHCGLAVILARKVAIVFITEVMDVKL